MAPTKEAVEDKVEKRGAHLRKKKGEEGYIQRKARGSKVEKRGAHLKKKKGEEGYVERKKKE